MDKVQQTIVMRKKFPDSKGGLKKLPIGKYCAQASHASMAFLTIRMRMLEENKPQETIVKDTVSQWDYQREIEDRASQWLRELNSSEVSWRNVPLTEEEQIWVDDKFTKICLGVESEEELLDIYEQAKTANLTVSLIVDAGDTCFNGVPTYTCLAIGPHLKSKIDPITQNLELF